MYGCSNLTRSEKGWTIARSTTVLTDDDFTYGGTTYTLNVSHQEGGSSYPKSPAVCHAPGIRGPFQPPRPRPPSASADAERGRPQVRYRRRQEHIRLTAIWAGRFARPVAMDRTGRRCRCRSDFDKLTAPPRASRRRRGTAGSSCDWADYGNPTVTEVPGINHKAGNAAWGAWTDIAGSGAATTSHTVTGLRNGTGYRFRIRAVNALGARPGVRHEIAPATPHVPAPAGPPSGPRR